MKFITIKQLPFIKPAAGLIGGLLFSANCHAETEPVEDWFNGTYATGNWGGVRDSLSDHGVTVNALWLGNYYGLVSGGLDQKGIYDEEWQLKLSFDFGKLTGNELLNGLRWDTKIRYRDGTDINQYVGASNAFDPSNIQGGKYWRFRESFLTYKAPELFGVKDFLTLSGGWQNPYHYFAVQPESKLFDNTAIVASKGLSMNGVPWSGTYAAWGGYVRVQPNKTFYMQAGGYGAIVGANATENHGRNFDKETSGNEFIGELGYTPKIGSSELAGKYVIGGLYWGVDHNSFSGREKGGRYSVYLQADQQLFRESSAEEAPGGAKSAAGSGAAGVKKDEQGLNWFNFFVFSKEENNVVPFYFHTGLTYKGLIPGRELDQIGIAFGYANYSDDKADFEELAGKSIHQEHEGVIEAVYRVQVNQWAFIQPFAQYVVHPGGTGVVPDAKMVGVQAGITF